MKVPLPKPLTVSLKIDILASDNTWRQSEITEILADGYFKAKVVQRLAPTRDYVYGIWEENVGWRHKS